MQSISDEAAMKRSAEVHGDLSDRESGEGKRVNHHQVRLARHAIIKGRHHYAIV